MADITVPNTQKINEATLVLNGAGIREKYWLDLYVGGLYLKEKSSDANKIINADEPMSIKLHIISSLITSEKMIEAVDEGFKKSTKGNTAPLQTKIDQFKSSFKAAFKIGDIFDINYATETGISISKNSKLVTTIKGLDFKKALVGIWLGADPADEDLKIKLLGK